MVSINTNLSSFLVKQQLSSSTRSLNQAIERMTTGFKVNHSSDNAANYAIIQNMDKNINAYDVAADNVAMGSDFAAVADDALTLVSSHMQRIKDLLTQASNGTYGEDSRKAIQAEVDSRLDEINRIFKSTEYNGINLFNSAILPSTLNVKIGDINLKAGSFNVNVGGADFTVNITNDDSLYSIISKLNAIGVDADFNEESGVLTVELDPNKITDNGTGFVSVLGLDKTDGYLAENLKTTEVYTILESANANTQLSAAGITDGSFTIIDSEGHETYDAISVDATINELFNKLWTHQISGNINSNGVVTFNSTNGNRISGALAEQLGINVDVVDTIYTGLTVNTTNTLKHSFISNANSNTTLDKLGVQAGEKLVVKNTEGNEIYSFTADNSSIQNTTLGELFNNIVDAGYLSNVSVNNGVVSITSDVNNYVTGSIADRFGIKITQNDNATSVGISQTSSDAVIFNKISDANSNTTLAELGIANGETFIINNNSGEELYKFTADNISIQNTTIGDFLNDLVNEGYLTSANITDGVISLSSNVNNYAAGSIANRLGIGVKTTRTTETVIYDQTSSSAVTYVETLLADKTSTLADIGIQAGDTLVIRNNSGAEVYEFVADNNTIQNTSIDDFFGSFVNYGYLSSADITNGVLSISSYMNNYVTGTIADKLGITVNTESVSETFVSDVTSSSPISYRVSGLIDGDTKLKDIGIQSGDSLDVYNQDGIVMTRFTAYDSYLNTKTLNDVFDSLSSYVNANISNGEISVSSDEYYYLGGAIANRLGISPVQQRVNVTSAISQTSSDKITYNKTGLIENGVSLASTGIEEGDTLSVRDNDGNIIYTYSATEYSIQNDTIDGVFDYINRMGYISNFSLSNGVISVSSSDNNYLTGSIADKFNIGVNSEYRTETAAITATSASAVAGLNYYTTLEDLGLPNASFVVRNQNGLETISVSSTDYIRSALVGAGLEVDISGNKITISGGVNNYIQSMSSGLAAALKIQVGEGKTYEEQNNIYHTNTDSSPISCTGSYSMTERSTLHDITGVNSASVTLDNGTVITLGSDDSVYDKLNSYLSVDIYNGNITISGKGGRSLKDMTPAFANALKIEVGEGKTYSVSNPLYYVNPSSSPRTVEKTYTLTNSSTLSDLGLTGASFTMNNGTTININSSDSIYSKLRSAGLDAELVNGELSISGDNSKYIKSMTPELAEKLNIQIGNGYNYEINSYELHTNSNSATQKVENTITLDTETTLINFGINRASVTLDNGNIVNINTNDSIYSKLTNAGLDVSINNGKITITGGGEHYLKSMSANLKDVLKIEAGEGKSYQINTSDLHTNTPSATQKVRTTSTITTSTTFGDFGLNNATVTLGDNTTVTIKANDTIYTKLHDSGLDMRIGLDGKISLSGIGDNFIKDMSSNLANILHIQVGENKTYSVNHDITYSNTNSKTQTYLSTATLTSANSSTYRMSDWGLNTNSKIYTNNVAITINKSDKISDVITKLGEAGIRASVNNENGTLKIENSNNNYITSVDSALKNVLGIEVGEGKTYNSTTVTHRSDTTSKILQENIKHTIRHDATESTLLKDFNKDNLNIEGDLVFDFADGQKTVKITSKDTIASFIDKLKEIGIKAIFKDQALSISGNKNSVLLLDSSSSTTSYLAELLGLEYKNTLEGITSSNDINALADSIYAEKFNTPNLLCIQAGIHGNEHDMISMDMSLKLGRVSFKTSDPISASKGLDKIDQLISQISAKQTEYGAFSNRMESAAESITVSLQNLVSSKSTLQDADIAVESSNYIRAQILQQAAATLLATANQIPAIAIQLI